MLFQPIACPARVRSSRRQIVVLGLSAGLLAGCSGSRHPDTASAGPGLRATVESTTTAFHQALRTNDSAGVLAAVADDVIMLPPGEAPVRGKEGMRAWYAAFLTQYRTSALTLNDREVFVGEGWATELGGYEWHLTPVAGGAPTVDRGHYMQVWRQLPTGQWRFAREVWNSSVPTAAPGSQP